MSTVEKRGDKWRLTAYLGYDALGNQIKKRKTLPAKNMSKTEARHEAAIWEKNMKRSMLRIDDKSLTVSGFIAYWWENYGNDLSVTTKVRDKRLFERIEALIGHIRLDRLESEHLLLMMKQLKKPGIRMDKKPGKLSSRTIQMHYELMSGVLNKAVQWKFIPDNPLRFVDHPSATIKKTPIYQEDDTAQLLYFLLTEAPTMHKCFFLFAFTDGLRRSEVMGIDERHLNFEKGYLDIMTAGVIGDNGLEYKDTTKTEESQIRMSIAKVTLEVAQQLLQERRDIEEALGLDHVTKLFTHPDGTPIWPDSFTKWLQRFSSRHGLPHITTQSMRKMAVTYVLPAVNLKEASEFARHTNIQTTAKSYSEVLSSRREIPTNLLNSIVETAFETHGKDIQNQDESDGCHEKIRKNMEIAENKPQI